VARSFREENAAKPVSDSASKGEKRPAVDVLCFIFRASTSEQFCFTHNWLYGKFSCPPTQKRASHKIVPSANNKFFRMVKKNPKWVHETVGMPSATH
jgi:hypothetical protein